MSIYSEILRQGIVDFPDGKEKTLAEMTDADMRYILDLIIKSSAIPAHLLKADEPKVGSERRRG